MSLLWAILALWFSALPQQRWEPPVGLLYSTFSAAQELLVSVPSFSVVAMLFASNLHLLTNGQVIDKLNCDWIVYLVVLGFFLFCTSFISSLSYCQCIALGGLAFIIRRLPSPVNVFKVRTGSQIKARYLWSTELIAELRVLFGWSAGQSIRPLCLSAFA